jgi:hypothetical protein
MRAEPPQPQRVRSQPPPTVPPMPGQLGTESSPAGSSPAGSSPAGSSPPGSPRPGAPLAGALRPATLLLGSPRTKRRAPLGRLATWAVVALTGTITCLAMSGCDGAAPSSGGSAPTSGTAATASVQRQALAVWLDFARCARAHGVPDFPDPRVNSDGRASFPGSSTTIKSETAQVQGLCGSILGRLPASAKQTQVTSAQLQQLVAFARCMRLHGEPGFPDPKPDGTFQVAGTPLAHGKTPQFLAAAGACRQYHSGGISGS